MVKDIAENSKYPLSYSHFHLEIHIIFVKMLPKPMSPFLYSGICDNVISGYIFYEMAFVIGLCVIDDAGKCVHIQSICAVKA